LCRRFKFSPFLAVGGGIIFVIAFEKVSPEAGNKLFDNFLLIMILGSLELIDALV
jgi:hypothetical protein